MKCALMLISKPSAHTGLSFPSYDPPVALSLHHAIFFITNSSLLTEENSLELFGEQADDLMELFHLSLL